MILLKLYIYAFPKSIQNSSLDSITLRIFQLHIDKVAVLFVHIFVAT